MHINSLPTEQALSLTEVPTKDSFLRDLCVANEDIKAGVSTGRAWATTAAWKQWEIFCLELDTNPFLKSFQDKIPVLQVFIQQVQEGKLAKQKNQVCARLVDDYLCCVAQMFLGLGAQDHRLIQACKIDFCIQRMIACWKEQDPPPNQVKPVPI